MRKPARTPPPQALDVELDASLALINATLDAAANGDLEQRVPPVPHPALAGLRDRFNRLLDVSDAFVRESSAPLAAAVAGQFHRRLLVQGMPGSFREGADRIDAARRQMKINADDLQAHEKTRASLADQVVEVAEHVAAASVELGATAETLAASTKSSVAEVQRALDNVRRLDESAEQIEAAVTLIRQVAARTRLLSLNATIEAARAGEAGKGFAVVAQEVKALADSVAAASEDIVTQVAEAQRAARQAAADMDAIAGQVREMDVDVAGVADAAGDHGLAQMAVQLRQQVEAFSTL